MEVPGARAESIGRVLTPLAAGGEHDKGYLGCDPQRGPYGGFQAAEGLRHANGAMSLGFRPVGLPKWMGKNLAEQVLTRDAELRGIDAFCAGRAMLDGSYESLVALMESCARVVGIL